MRKQLASAIVTLMVTASSLAWAWEPVSGTITRIDHQAGTLALDNGKTYTLLPAVAHTDAKVGDKVTVTTQVEQGKNVVNKIEKTG